MFQEIQILPQPPSYWSRLWDAVRGREPRPRLTAAEKEQLKKDHALWMDLTAGKNQFNLIIKGERREAMQRLLQLAASLLD